MKILIVEDNELLGKSIRKGLEESGWTVDLARDGEEGLYCASNGAYDLILVDRMLPLLSGDALVARLRGAKSQVPIIMLTARSSVQDRIAGLEVGADDYLPKPFDMGELVARIRALLRRAMGTTVSTLTLGRLVVDLGGRAVATADGDPIGLTSKEFDLLTALGGRQQQLVTRPELLSLLYEMNEEPESNSLDVLIARLRRKVAGTGVEIATIRGKGYVLRVEPTAP